MSAEKLRKQKKKKKKACVGNLGLDGAKGTSGSLVLNGSSAKRLHILRQRVLYPDGLSHLSQGVLPLIYLKLLDHWP